ncbi:MAG: trypsin-like peptidase domain-containing protein [Candidatus Omnitrophica bacterium]|nr:trypsin-like peptidase domain-containing protein [Candidatus Omnitrophota bacterium]
MPTFLLLTALCYLFSSGAWASPPNAISTIEHIRDAIVTVQGKAIRIAENQPNAVGMYETNGAGVIVDPTGLIVTNTHVIYETQWITVTLEDGTSYPATLVQVSPFYDVSVIRISAGQPLHAVEFANPDEMTLGEKVITIGHSPLLLKTISGGTITAIGVKNNDPSKTPQFLELNINHYEGDSGGPVFDENGYFLGLISAKRSSVNRASFAIPAEMIRQMLTALAEGRANAP